MVVSPSATYEYEAMLMKHRSDSSRIFGALKILEDYLVNIVAIPSITVSSLFRKSQNPPSIKTDWFASILGQVVSNNPKRVGVIATEATLNYSPLIQMIRDENIEVVQATHLTGNFHEWILSCGSSGTVAPSEQLASEYAAFFSQENIDLCLLACTEACLPQAAFSSVHPLVVNALSVLEELIVDHMPDLVIPPESNGIIRVW